MFRRRRLIMYHELEQQLLRDELKKRQSQLESAHSMLLRHHEMTQGCLLACAYITLSLGIEHILYKHITKLFFKY